MTTTTTTKTTTLHDATATGNIIELNALIMAGADVNTTDCYGNTPLNWAADNGHTEIVKALKTAGGEK